MSLAWIFDDTITPAWAKEWQTRINTQLGGIVATLAEVLDGLKSWGTSWKDRALAETARADTAAAGLTDAQAAAAAAAEALAQFQADDAATDASQIQAQVEADAQAAQAVLDEVLAADVPPAPPQEPPANQPPTDQGPTGG